MSSLTLVYSGTYQVTTTFWVSSDYNFYAVSVSGDRSIVVSEDGIDILPSAPPIWGYIQPYVPNILLEF